MHKLTAEFSRSAQLFSDSQRYLAGGVSSSMRASSKPLPLFFTAGTGSRLTDVDGHEYIDYTLAWGPLILGHSHPAMVAAVRAQLRKSQTIGAQCELEIAVAKQICEMVPCAECVVFSNTGSEAAQIAFRLARAYTGKTKIIRFEGHYHGWLDNVLPGYRPDLNPQAGKTTWPSAGMNPGVTEETVILPWNDLHIVEATLKEAGQEIAAIITEPILCNSQCLMPEPGYLEGLRGLATRHGVVLIFDEVITGFRVARGGAQSLFKVKPDLATFAKAAAGGFPLSVVAGRKDIMDLIAQRKVVHAGTFNGNPISLAAAYATLQLLNANDGAALQQIRETGESLIRGITEAAEAAGIPHLINGIGPDFSLSFTRRQKMVNYRDTLDSDLSARDQFLQAMLAEGIYLMPDGRWYISLAHTAEDVTRTLVAVRKVFAEQRARLVAAN
jgi:glutamate-1-semialdehyde 2,1-aminomutase